MKKIILSVLMLLISIISPLSISVRAADSYEISGLNSCEQIFLETKSDNVYAYGVNDKTIFVYNITADSFCSIPISGKICNYSVLNNGMIYCVYQDENYDYIITIFDMDGAEVKTIFLGRSTLFKYPLTVASDNGYFILTLSSYVYVSEYNFNGELMYEYKFENQNVDNVFINDGEVYAQLNNGEVYGIKDGLSFYSVTLNTCSDLTNVGDGYVADEENWLYSLKENKAIDCFISEAEFISVCGENVCYSNTENIYLCDISGNINQVYNYDFPIKNLTVSDNKVYMLSADNSEIYIVDFDEFSLYNSDNNNNQNAILPKTVSVIPYSFDNDIIYDIPLFCTIKDFKNNFNEIVLIYDKSAKEVKNGKLKTGFIAEFPDEKYVISLKGDITGTGTINNSDVSLLMESFTGEAELFGAYKKAADYNLDGCVDNKDLLLISREMD